MANIHYFFLFLFLAFLFGDGVESVVMQQQRLKSADDSFEAGFYEEAIASYSALLGDLEASDVVIEALARWHLAQAYFMQGRYDAVVALLENPKESDLADSHYLLGLTYKYLNNYPMAVDQLNAYLAFPRNEELQFRDEALFELGVLYFLQHDYDLAAVHFADTPFSRADLQSLALLYRARIALLQHSAQQALDLLGMVNPVKVDSALVRFELSYLRGEAYFQQRRYDQAIASFEQSLPNEALQKCRWCGDTFYYLGWSHVHLAHDHLEEATAHFNEAISLFKQLLARESSDRAYLALGQAYLAKAKQQSDVEAYAFAEALLSHPEAFLSSEGRSQALLLRAEAASTYADRDNLFQRLTAEAEEPSLVANGWYRRALNDFEEGQRLEESVGASAESYSMFRKAADNFKHALDLLKESDVALANEVVKYRALALSRSKSDDSDWQAFTFLDDFLHNRVSAEDELSHGLDEQFISEQFLIYLRGFFAARLAAVQHSFVSVAESSLKEVVERGDEQFASSALLQLGAMYYSLGDYTAAEKQYLQLVNTFPRSPQCAEAWLWAALCADKLDVDGAIARERRRKVFEEYPDSLWAAEAYFTLYSLHDYVQGDKQALRHLENFEKKYPDSPWLIQAYYLIGLDEKRDRKTAEGRWLRKRNLTGAIDAFQKAEGLFEKLKGARALPIDRIDDYAAIAYRANVERAYANLAIANESQGAKKQIYLEYSETVFVDLLDKLNSREHPYWRFAANDTSLYEECAFGLAQTYVKEGKDDKAEKILAEMITYYKKSEVQHGDYLSCAYEALGNIALRRSDYDAALHDFQDAEEAAKGVAIATDQRLGLLLQQSDSYRKMGQYDQAILVLSKVVNSDEISSLRLQAMYLRAEIYEQQKRLELARKQLESLVLKGGPWALKAKEKLEKEYGY